MPINTLQKLVSALKQSLPVPNAIAIDDGDLQHITWNYAGILAHEAIPPSVRQFAVVDHLSMGVGISRGVRQGVVVESFENGAGLSQGLARGRGTRGVLRTTTGVHDSLG